MHVRQHLNRFFGSLRRKTKETPEGERENTDNSLTSSLTASPKKKTSPSPFSQLNASLRRSVRFKGKGKGSKENSLSRCQLLDLDDQHTHQRGDEDPVDARDPEWEWDGRDVDGRRSTSCSPSFKEFLYPSHNDVISHENGVVRDSPGDAILYPDDVRREITTKSTIQTKFISDSNNSKALPVPGSCTDDKCWHSSTKSPRVSHLQVQVNVEVGSPMNTHQQYEENRKIPSANDEDDVDKILFEENYDELVKNKSSSSIPTRKETVRSNHEEENKIWNAATNQPSTSVPVPSRNNTVAVVKKSKKEITVQSVRKSGKLVRKALKAGFISWTQSLAFQYSTAVFPDFYECPPTASLAYHNHDPEKSYPWLQHRHYHVHDSFGLHLNNPNQICQMSY